MNKRAFYVLLKEFSQGKDKDLGNVVLVSFNKLTPKDQLDVLLEQGECTIENGNFQERQNDSIKDAIKQANDLELIKMKSFLLKSIIWTLILAFLAFIGLTAYYIHMESDNSFFEYIDQLVKMVKLIILDKSS